MFWLAVDGSKNCEVWRVLIVGEKGAFMARDWSVAQKICGTLLLGRKRVNNFHVIQILSEYGKKAIKRRSVMVFFVRTVADDDGMRSKNHTE